MTAFFLRYRQPITIGAIILLCVVILFVLSECTNWRNRSAVTAQANQTTASGEAMADAANNAVETVIARSDSDNMVDAAVVVAQEEIGNAQSPDEIRSAVVDAMCLRDTSYCDDAARPVR